MRMSFDDEQESAQREKRQVHHNPSAAFGDLVIWRSGELAAMPDRLDGPMAKS
jgi:hypothetical protein